MDGGQWAEICRALNGAGVESVQGKWEEMFGVKDEGGMMKDEEKEGKKSVKRKTKEGAAKRTAAKKPAEKKPKAKKKSSRKPATKKGLSYRS